MVVLLHRHFFLRRPEWDDRDDDARYVFEKPGGGSKTSYLIQNIEGRRRAGREELSDRDVTDADVLKRILRPESHHAPFVDSTLYFGLRGGPAMISIEHKKTDQDRKSTRLNSSH